jgi:hypothetical protein
MARKDVSTLVGPEKGVTKLNNLSESENSFLGKYFSNTFEDSSLESCEYCGNGCGTSDCASCCSQPDDYVKFANSKVA